MRCRETAASEDRWSFSPREPREALLIFIALTPWIGTIVFGLIANANSRRSDGDACPLVQISSPLRPRPCVICCRLDVLADEVADQGWAGHHRIGVPSPPS